MFIVYCRHSDLDFYLKLHFDSDFSPKSDSGEKDKILRKAIEKYGYGFLKTVSKHLKKGDTRFKKEDSKARENYGPIVVLSCVNKVFERLLGNQITSKFNSYLGDCLTAYRKHHSDESTLIGLWQRVIRQHPLNGQYIQYNTIQYNILYLTRVT